MVQMKVTASVLIAAAAIAPIVAQGFETEDSLLTREDNEFENSFARGFDLELEEREFDDVLFEREPFRGGKFLKKAFRMGRKGAGAVSPPVSPPQTPNEAREFEDDLLEREFDDELFEREPFRGGKFLKKAFRMGRKGAGAVSPPVSPPQTPNEAREFEDDLFEREFDDELFEREPFRGGKFLKKAFRMGRKGAGAVSPPVSPPQTPNEAREFEDDLLERELDELFEREPFRGGKFLKKAFRMGRKGAGAVSPPVSPPQTPNEAREFEDDVLERELDELFERDPLRGGKFLRKAFRMGRKGAGAVSPPVSPPQTPNEAREFNGELFGRDVDLELFGREPEPFLFLGRIKKWWKNRKGKTATAPTEDAPETRSVDEVELLEREYYDELD